MSADRLYDLFEDVLAHVRLEGATRAEHHAQLTRVLSATHDAAAIGDRVARLKFDLRTAILEYGTAFKRDDPESVRETTTRGSALIDMLAAMAAPASQAAHDVLAERRRQVDVEGYTAEHDGKMTCDELAKAGACYALSMDLAAPPAAWPWSSEAWKPKLDYRNNLVRGAALYLAAIELFDRAAAAVGSTNSGAAS